MYLIDVYPFSLWLSETIWGCVGDVNGGPFFSNIVSRKVSDNCGSKQRYIAKIPIPKAQNKKRQSFTFFLFEQTFPAKEENSALP